MFSLFKKKKIVLTNKDTIKMFDEANKSCVKNIEDITKLRNQVEDDMVVIEQTLIDITTAVNNIIIRVEALESQLSVKNIKFSNN